MNAEADPILDLIAARTRHLRSMAAELLESRRALSSFDVEAIHTHNAAQELLCAQVRGIDAGLRRCLDARDSWTGEALEKLQTQLDEHEAARTELHGISRVQDEFLIRSRRHLRILFNIVANHLGLYPAPKFRCRPTWADGRGS